MMDTFIDTEKYTLVPEDYMSGQDAAELLSALHDTESASVYTVKVPAHHAVMIYALPHGEKEACPSVCRMLALLPEISVPHKLLVRYMSGMVHVVLADKERLLLINTYAAPDFTSALYHIFLAMKEVMFEPDHTVFHWCGNVSPSDLAVVSDYFERQCKVEF